MSRAKGEDRPQELSDLLDEMEATVDRDVETTVGGLHEAIGVRSFGPLLVAVGIAGVTPLAGVPGVPTLLALCVLLVAAQLLIGRKHFWLPGWFLRRKVKRSTVRRSVRLARWPAKAVDRVIRPRLHALTGPAANRLVAVLVAAIAVTVPALELLPFAAALPSLAILAFGLGLSARDGALVLLASVISSACLALAGWKLVG